MIYVWHHALSPVVAIASFPLLSRTAWAHRAPRVTIVLWQITTLTAVAALIGLFLALGLAPYERGIGPALVLFVTDLGDGRSPVPWAGEIAAVSAGLALAGWILFNQRPSLRTKPHTPANTTTWSWHPFTHSAASFRAAALCVAPPPTWRCCWRCARTTTPCAATASTQS